MACAMCVLYQIRCHTTVLQALYTPLSPLLSTTAPAPSAGAVAQQRVDRLDTCTAKARSTAHAAPALSSGCWSCLGMPYSMLRAAVCCVHCDFYGKHLHRQPRVLHQSDCWLASFLQSLDAHNSLPPHMTPRHVVSVHVISHYVRSCNMSGFHTSTVQFFLVMLVLQPM